MIEGGIRISNPKIKKKEPLITIITVVKNGEKFLEECIKSVLNQSYKDFEYIIIDGNSSDGTSEVIKKANRNQKKINYIRKKDKNISIRD